MPRKVATEKRRTRRVADGVKTMTNKAGKTVSIAKHKLGVKSAQKNYLIWWRKAFTEVRDQLKPHPDTIPAQEVMKLAKKEGTTQQKKNYAIVRKRYDQLAAAGSKRL